MSPVSADYLNAIPPTRSTPEQREVRSHTRAAPQRFVRAQPASHHQDTACRLWHIVPDVASVDGHSLPLILVLIHVAILITRQRRMHPERW